MGEKLTDQMIEAFKRRTTSTTLASYLFFWCTYHWQGIYTTLFTSEKLIFQKYHLLKNEYVNQYFFGQDVYTPTGLDWYVVAVRWLLSFLVPAFLTWMFVWILSPHLLERAYRKEQRHKNAKLRIKHEEAIELEELKEQKVNKATETVEKELSIVQKELELANKKKEVAKKDPINLLRAEFDKFKTNKLNLAQLQEILECIYNHDSRIKIKFSTGRTIFELSPNSLMMGDLNELIQINDGNRTISLTSKGKLFAKLYAEQKDELLS